MKKGPRWGRKDKEEREKRKDSECKRRPHVVEAKKKDGKKGNAKGSISLCRREKRGAEKESHHRTPANQTHPRGARVDPKALFECAGKVIPNAIPNREKKVRR